MQDSMVRSFLFWCKLSTGSYLGMGIVDGMLTESRVVLRFAAVSYRTIMDCDGTIYAATEI